MLNDIDDTNLDEQHKRSAWFDKRIAIWNLDGEQKAEIAGQIIDDMTIKLEYRSQMFLSIVIATLWLLINATPVVIWAMIIAPILRPIQAIWFATSTWNRSLFGKSIWTMFASIIGWVFIAFVLTLFLPLTEITNEIAIRTQPTLVDLWIAFASWLVAFLSFWWKKMAVWLAGVAMAASLIPPLAVIGIGIGFGSMSIAWWSTVLFLTNLIAIIIAGILVFYLFGFHPTQKDDLKRSVINSVSALIMLMLLCIPLASSLVTITKNVHTQSTIKNITNTVIANIDDRISIETLGSVTNSDYEEISLTLKVPQEILKKITEEEQTNLAEQLSSALENEVVLDLRLLPVTRVTKTTEKIVLLHERIENSTREFLKSLYHWKAELLTLDYYTSNKRIIVATIFSDSDFPTSTFSQKYDIFIKEAYPEVEKILINRQYETSNTTTEPTVKQKMQQDITASFTNYFLETILHKLDTSITEQSININIYASTPLSNEAYDDQVASWEQLLFELFNKEVNTTSYVSFLEEN